MQIGNTIIDFAGVAALLLSIWTIYKGYASKKEKEAQQSSQKIVSDAEASEKYAKVAGLSAEQLARKIKEIDELRGEMSLMRKKFSLQTDILNEWRIGIGRLIHQIGMHDETPVWEPDFTKLDKLNNIDENEKK